MVARDRRMGSRSGCENAYAGCIKRLGDRRVSWGVGAHHEIVLRMMECWRQGRYMPVGPGASI